MSTYNILLSCLLTALSGIAVTGTFALIRMFGRQEKQDAKLEYHEKWQDKHESGHANNEIIMHTTINKIFDKIDETNKAINGIAKDCGKCKE